MNNESSKISLPKSLEPVNMLLYIENKQTKQTNKGVVLADVTKGNDLGIEYYPEFSSGKN